MGIEIERRFLVENDSWRQGASVTRLKQGFLSVDKERVVRVRLEGDDGTLTIKGLTRNNTKKEFEYAIPSQDALELLHALCLKPLIEKHRFRVVYDGFSWDVDVFEGENRGLVIAEIELDRGDQPFAKPPWLGREISDDPRYFNANLGQNPYCRWGGA
ncbi:MAG: CYTH domain-containing protein [Nitrospirae bacterium]|nr:CYTH domain-containing protein [Magnetococcales bacterium]